MQSPSRHGPDAPTLVVCAGVSAALHVGKLAPAIAALQQAMDITLVQAGFVLSLVQLAGMLLGVAFGAWADGLGAVRSMRIGLLVLAAASAAGGAVQGAAALPLLMALRVAEGCGFLLVVLPAPGLLRALAAPQRASSVLGVWSAYMPLGTALALLAGPLVIAGFGWRAWWWVLAALSLAMAVALRGVPVPALSSTPEHSAATRWAARLRRTLSAPGPWLVALCFAVYSGQWLAVVGFLPTIYLQAGVSGSATGVATALAAAANIGGNVAAGRLLQRGVAPLALLCTGFAAMALGAAAAFAEQGGHGLPPPLRYAAVLVFSGIGGLIPATLFALALRVAPGAQTVSTTVGWVQQWSSFGQFAGPPLVAWVAARAGGWQLTWLATGACSAVGLLLSIALTWQQARRHPRPVAARPDR